MKAHETVPWHGLQIAEALALLDTNLDKGLSEDQAKVRLAKYGPNRVTRRPGTPAWKSFLLQFHQPLIYILLLAGAITAGLGEIVDSSVIFGVVVVNAIVGFLQEGKAEKAIDSLSRLTRSDATVRRDGKRRRIASDELVPGDVVLLDTGDRVPGDLRLTAMRQLRVDESALTGESLSVAKHPGPVAKDAMLADRSNLAFAGTLVTSGNGQGVVWATGDRTETGRIAWLISEAVNLDTPLTRKVAEFSRLLLWLILGLSGIVVLVEVWRGKGLVEIFMPAVALAVGAIPEGLPAVVTITLAIGVARMAARRAIIRNLPAVETLGSTTTICSDKTGTLTKNQMTVQEIYAGGRLFEVTGTGYNPAGDLRLENRTATPRNHPALIECLKAGLLCNDSQLVQKEGRWEIEGDPTEGALVVAARKAGLQPAEIDRAHPRIDAIPFESANQFMATLHAGGHGKERTIYKKGAAEGLLERCTASLDERGAPVPLDLQESHRAIEQMARKGLRVLAFASRQITPDQQALEHVHVAEGLTFLGLQGMIDPPRPEAIAAVERCRRAGIRVKVITGDHLVTARAIAKKFALVDDSEDGRFTVSGRELERLTAESAVEEGRCVFDNLTKFIVWTLPTNGGEALTLLTAVLFGTTLPALPVQLRWLLAGVAAMIIAQMAFTYVPFMNATFHSRPLDADSWLRLIAVAFAVSMIVAFEKRLRARPGPIVSSGRLWNRRRNGWDLC